MTAPLAICDSPQVVFEEILGEVRSAIIDHPRSQQKRIGPSEIGNPCDRALIAALMELPEPNHATEPPNWRATVGTAIHSWLEDVVRRSVCNTTAAGPRYLLETRVTIGAIGAWQLVGQCDVFDMLSGTVIDHKTKSKTRLQEHHRHGPGETYRVQAHCYGYGLAAAGYQVNTVMIIYYPRDGELADVFYWAEPYDESVAVAALERANRLYALAQLLGADLAIAQYPKCTEEFCRHCPGNYRAPYAPPRSPISTTIAAAVVAATSLKGK